MSKSLDLTGRVAVVMGATSGIGRTLALGLAQYGADVVPAGRREEELASVCKEIEALGQQTLLKTCDVRDRASIDALRDAVLGNFGRVDILVNAAGITLKKPTTEVTLDQWHAVMDTSLTGTLLACQSFFAALKASGHGRIVNLASLGSFLAFYEVAAYCAAKTGVVSLTRSLAVEWARDKICVNAIAPGVIPTALNTKLLKGTARGKEILVRTPMGRFGNAEELVGAAVLLASDAASFLTGQCIAVDGGYLASGVNL
jgi:NAD(P)-dependent dehydrogenase (short-subunit alcohol dehydrogenase family)